MWCRCCVCCGTACRTETRVPTRSSTTTRRRTSGPGFVEPCTACWSVCRASVTVLGPSRRPQPRRHGTVRLLAVTRSTRLSDWHRDFPQPWPPSGSDDCPSTRSLKQWHSNAHRHNYDLAELIGLAVRCFYYLRTKKQIFGPSYCQVLTDLDKKILHTPIAVRNTFVGRLRPRSARGRRQTKPERLFFCNCNAP